MLAKVPRMLARFLLPTASRASIAAVLAQVLCLTCAANNRSPLLYPERRDASVPFDWTATLLSQVPPLKHERGQRWPMILWEAGPLHLQRPQFYKDLLARGLTQHIHLDAALIPIARALQDAGSPVIIMEPQGGTYPASMAGDPSQWAHQFDAGFTPKEPPHACPAIATGWAINANRIRDTLQKFRDAGIRVDAVWMDWESDPVAGSETYEQAIHCARCRATLPAGVLADRKSFEAYCNRRSLELLGTYLAAPVAEVYPGCSTTNWGVEAAAPEHPLRGWDNHPFTPRIPMMFTATNPVAYGMTMFLKQWQPSWPKDGEHIDELYTHLLLRETSNDTANRRLFAPHLHSVPWIARWCAAYTEQTGPIMSRPRYREVLRHLWLRGVTGMQVFNELVKNHEGMALYEVQDAVTVYDEMLSYAEFLDSGEVMNLANPQIQDTGVIWSGLRKGNEAIVRTFKQGGGSRSFELEPWKGRRMRLTATSNGETYLLRLAPNGSIDQKLVETPAR